MIDDNKNNLKAEVRKAPVDMSYIQACIGDDKEREKELCGMYLEQAEECLENLKKAYEDKDSENWRKLMHLLKGASLNIGADELSAICKEGELGFEESDTVKEKILAEVNKYFLEVKDFFAAR